MIRGTAINNDGAAKMGYGTQCGRAGRRDLRGTTPAGVDPSTISYVEAHGTGTRWRSHRDCRPGTSLSASTQPKQYCAIGSVKSNIGHLDAAAGIAGLIKTVLALQHKRIPASLGFETPNPLIDLASSPFYVNGKLASWPAEAPRRAGVSSFRDRWHQRPRGPGRSPAQAEPVVQWPAQLMVLSATTAPALGYDAAHGGVSP